MLARRLRSPVSFGDARQQEGRHFGGAQSALLGLGYGLCDRRFDLLRQISSCGAMGTVTSRPPGRPSVCLARQIAATSAGLSQRTSTGSPLERL